MMESSAPKRRKTSENSNVPASNSNSDASHASSDSVTRRSARLNRPSFASPTRASLARSYSDILSRRNATRRSAPPNQEEKEESAPAASELDNNSPSVSDDGLVTAQLEAESETGRLQDADAENDARDVKGKGKAAAVPTRSTSPIRRTRGGMAVNPKRSPFKNVPSPRPLPPPSAEEEELIDPFKSTRRLRRSPPPGVLPPAAEPEEPELPPTPSQKDSSDPAAAISSPLSPSKRPRRSKLFAERMKSSPLKRPPLRPPEDGEEGKEGSPVVQGRAARDPLRHSPRRRRKKRGPHPARKVEEVEPLADKKALRDALLAEVASLQKDLDVVTRENERLYILQESGRGTDSLPDAQEQKHLLDVLSRHAVPQEEEPTPDPTRDWLEAAMNPILFLPFGQANAASLPPLTMPQPEGEKDDPLPPPVSHHPIPMTAEEELPHLQVFTPLRFTSTITTIPRQDGQEGEDAQDPLLQKHNITVTSTPAGLFVAGIEMVVNTKTLTIIELTIPRLEPNAVNELGPYLERLLHGRSNNSALTRNISVMTWAMGEWVRAATRRAWFWHAIEREMSTTEDILLCAQTMRQKSRRKRWRGRSRPSLAAEENEDEGEDETGSDSKSEPSLPHLIFLMGRAHLDLDLSAVVNDGDGDGDDPLTARIQWRIEFDWTGEASSEIGLLLGTPTKWRTEDKQGRLAGIPKMFSELLRENKDPMEALRTVVALIVDDEVTGA